MVSFRRAVPSPARHVDLLGYRVHVAPGLLNELGHLVADVAPAHRYAVITDQNVGALYGASVRASFHQHVPDARVAYRAIPAGEKHKSREQWSALTDWLLDEGCGRDTTLIALGGGVVGDLAGFVAATFMRGIPVVQAPTSLLAMVDASVGGKVGVDTPAGKNLVGAFHQPALVLIDPSCLGTLPLPHLKAGLAEVIKHGVIADARYLDEVISLASGLVVVDNSSDLVQDDGGPIWTSERILSMIVGSVEIKAAVVAGDEREHGRRQVLNFGHTVGHAVEAESEYTLLHGEAVAIGMSAESCLAEALGVAMPGLHATIVDALGAVGLPHRLPPDMDAAGLVRRMHADKKGRGGHLVFALPVRPGEMAGADSGFGLVADDGAVQAALRDPRLTTH